MKCIIQAFDFKCTCLSSCKISDAVLFSDKKHIYQILQYCNTSLTLGCISKQISTLYEFQVTLGQRIQSQRLNIGIACYSSEPHEMGAMKRSSESIRCVPFLQLFISNTLIN